MMKRVFLIILAMMTACMLPACVSSTRDEEGNDFELAVYTRYGTVSSQYLKTLTQGDSPYTPGGEELFLSGGGNFIPYVPLYETVYLSLPFLPEGETSAYLLDTVIDRFGTPKYDAEPVHIEIQFTNQTASFTLDENFAAMLSSRSRDYAQGAVIRGFTLYVDLGGETAVFFFALRSDASKSLLFEEPGQADDDTNTHQVLPADTVDLSGMSVYWYAEAFNFPADNNAQLILYTDAAFDDKGRYAFNDGNYWLLVLRSSEGTFVLLDKTFLQLGGVSVKAFADMSVSEDSYHVLISLNSSAELTVLDFIYNEESNVFNVQTVYSIGNINFNGMS